MPPSTGSSMITAHKGGTITALPIAEGDAVTAGDTLAVISSR